MNKAVELVVSNEIHYWRELAERHGCVVEIEADGDATRLTVEHPRIPSHAARILIIVRPARGGRTSTQTSILQTRSHIGRRRPKKLTRKDARFAIENMVSGHSEPSVAAPQSTTQRKDQDMKLKGDYAAMAEQAFTLYYGIACSEDREISFYESKVYRGAYDMLRGLVELAYPQLEAERVIDVAIDCGESIAYCAAVVEDSLPRPRSGKRFTTIQDAINDILPALDSDTKHLAHELAVLCYQYRIDHDREGNQLLNTAGFEMAVTTEEFWELVEKLSTRRFSICSKHGGYYGDFATQEQADKALTRVLQFDPAIGSRVSVLPEGVAPKPLHPKYLTDEQVSEQTGEQAQAQA